MLHAPNYIADLRYSMSVPANSSAAAKFAVDQYGMTSVLVEPIYSRGANQNESGIFFASLFCREVTALRSMPIMEWLTTLSRKHSLPRIDSLDDLLEIQGLSQIWLRITTPKEHRDEFFEILMQDYPEEEKLVLVSDQPLPNSLPYRCADPTGKRDYLLTHGSLSDWLKHPFAWGKSVALRSDGFSVLRTRAII